MPAFLELNQASVRRQVGVTVTQTRRLHELSENFWKGIEKYGIVPNVTVEERNSRFREFERRRKEVRVGVEGVLTVQQLAALGDICFRWRLLTLHPT